MLSTAGAAVGSLLVGLMQQFMIRYGQIGINLPFLDEPFKPTPPLVALRFIVALLNGQGLGSELANETGSAVPARIDDRDVHPRHLRHQL